MSRDWNMPKQRKSVKKREKASERKPERFSIACVMIFVLVIACFVSAFAIWAFNDSMHAMSDAVNARREKTEQAEMKVMEANDVPYSESSGSSSKSANASVKYKMPLYLQTQQSWSNVPYGNNTIGISGCGLTCAAMTVEWFTGERCTPFDLVNQVGSNCMVYADDGTLVNDMELFGDYLHEKYGFDVSEQYWNVKRALAEVNNDYSQTIVWAGVNGQLGNEWYDGHIIVIYHVGDEYVEIRDPYNQENSEARYSIYDFENMDCWTYFYTVKEGV